jgi:hypothetical protein
VRVREESSDCQPKGEYDRNLLLIIVVGLKYLATSPHPKSARRIFNDRESSSFPPQKYLVEIDEFPIENTI